MRPILVFSIVVSLAACANDKATKQPSSDTASSPQTRQTSRCAPGGTDITSQGVGAVKVGVHLRDILKDCSVTDTTVKLGDTTEAGHGVNVAGGTVVAITGTDRDTTVTRVLLSDGQFTTAKGVGVGKSLALLKQQHGALCKASQYGKTVYVASGLPGVEWVTDSTTSAPDSTAISQVWISAKAACSTK